MPPGQTLDARNKLFQAIAMPPFQISPLHLPVCLSADCHHPVLFSCLRR